jgi:multidrug efflux pump subunit AcrA (membrane-fusion protein)
MTEVHEHCCGVCVAALAAAAFLATPCLAQGGPPAKAVTVDPVRLEPVREHRRVTGELRAMSRSKVAAQEPGLVIEFPVREGDHVATGDVLIRLDSRRLSLELDALKADQRAVESLIEERTAASASWSSTASPWSGARRTSRRSSTPRARPAWPGPG